MDIAKHRNKGGLTVNHKIKRRELLGTAAAGLLLGSRSDAQQTNDTAATTKREVRLEYFKPKELKEAQTAASEAGYRT